MRQVRRGVFETNSSSTHTITIKGENKLEKSEFSTDINGKVRAKFGNYGWAFHPLETQAERLSYLLTMARIKTGCDEYIWGDGTTKKDKRNFEVTREFQAISDAVARNTPDCTGIRIDIDDYDEGELDHQSHEEFNSLEEFLDHCGTTIDEFIFGGDIEINDGGGGC